MKNGVFAICVDANFACLLSLQEALFIFWLTIVCFLTFFFSTNDSTPSHENKLPTQIVLFWYVAYCLPPPSGLAYLCEHFVVMP